MDNVVEAENIQQFMFKIVENKKAKFAYYGRIMPININS